MPLAPAYRPALRLAFAIQIFTILVAALILDEGLIPGITAILSAAFWLLTALTLHRRPTTPTSADLLFIRYWLLLVLPLSFAIAAILPRFR